MSTLEKFFVQLGLSPVASMAYLALLARGPQTIAELARRTKRHRPALYQCIPDLLAHGLVTTSLRGKRKLFAATSPDHLLELVDALREDVGRMLPELREQFGRRTDAPMIRTAEGRQGIGRIFDALAANVKSGEAIYRVESPRDYRRNRSYYPRRYADRASGQRGTLERFVITNRETHEARRKRLDRFSKHVPTTGEPFTYDITEVVFGDSLAIIDYETETAVVIEHARLAAFHRRLFQFLFDRLENNEHPG